MESNNIVIELHIHDFDKARDFYSKLDFEVVSEDPIGEHLGYMVLQLGSTRLNFYGGEERVSDHAFFRDFPKETPRGYEVEITIPVDDVEGYYKKVLSKICGHIAQELIMKRWGKKDFRLVDPFGFYLRFTEPMNWLLCCCGSGKNWKKCHGAS
ncbi:MAG: hypothetical protein A3A29_01690 [Candidatus Ryanbacteria bacterium RIFCSPLOWO2_01_FULL_47_79]|nr:MAG: hypothetical protein A2844_01610 [Candidatus Ryanbacteria bacterium RIFCSPHIGHO2_01_FULL_48_80]OGZ52456.1 MAG: hypothetical protein A3A29_01690 [Candidatus Ryanbacteria bacterium RIFCSPLOWO2_01_FULL_47_79]